MEFAKACCVAVAAAMAAGAAEVPARYGKLAGTLTVDERGVAYRDAKRAWNWTFQDIQQLTLAPDEIRVLTYRNSVRSLGADRAYRFRAVEGKPFAALCDTLRARMDQRLVVRGADVELKTLWEIPVKRMKTLGGSEGDLIVGEDRIVYRAAAGTEARTWRYGDIESVSSAGPFDLTITTYERDRLQYGGRKSFRFALKRPLEEDRYNELWRRLNLRKGTIRTGERP